MPEWASVRHGRSTYLVDRALQPCKITPPATLFGMLNSKVHVLGEVYNVSGIFVSSCLRKFIHSLPAW